MLYHWRVLNPRDQRCRVEVFKHGTTLQILLGGKKAPLLNVAFIRQR